ncbi:MAG: hypothetical protein JW862_15155 [Anaerolineales bacterium]|nr:hypothetical protein [Anaerolineales bacterium]
MPPVLVRKSGYGAGSGKPVKSRQPRRRFDIALSSPGVEVRLPALPAIQLGWRLLSFALLAGLLVLLYHLLTSPLYKLQAVELQGAQRLSAQQVNATLNLYNRSIFEIVPSEIDAILRGAYPELTDIQIQIGLPAAVYLAVQERTPLIAWHQDGQTLWIDRAGVAFPPRGEVDGLVDVQAHAAPPAARVVEVQEQGMAAETEVPNAAGGSTGPAVFIKPELVGVIQELALQMPAESALVYDPQHGLGWYDLRGWDVYFGLDTDDMAMKLTVYQAIAQDLQGRGITPALINVEFVHAPYYRMER